MKDEETAHIKLDLEDDDSKEERKMPVLTTYHDETPTKLNSLDFYEPGPKMSCSLAGRQNPYERRRSKKLLIMMEPDPVRLILVH